MGVGSIVALISVLAAEPAAASASLGATVDSSTATATAESTASGGTDEKTKTRWLDRYAPENNMGEIGIFGGVLFPSSRLELFQADPTLIDQGYRRLGRAAPEIGLRGGYYPLRFLGLELEAALMPGRVPDVDRRALLWAVRGHVVAQLGLWSLTPFVLAGTGANGVASDRAAVGNDVDLGFHFGGGLKAFINRWVQLRLDIRDNLTARRGVARSVTHSPEILLGVSVTLGRKSDGSQPDRDSDGVIDWRDRCPDESGSRPWGCPIDEDKDGILPPQDKCPEVPEARNGYEDDDGCPDVVPEPFVGFAGIMRGINFDIDKDTITADSQPTLEHAAEVMAKFPNIRVEISGHTDSTGGHDHNMDLSRRRSEAVKRYLVGKGIAEDRMITRGAGPDEPVATNATKEGRAQNRRIEFKILSEDSP